MSDTSTQPALTKEKDVPLGPACLVFFLVGAVVLSVFVIYMSAMLMGNQGRRAAYAVRELLIPWVEQSSLSETDRRDIVESLSSLAPRMEREELTSRQLHRLQLRLHESTILQWGVVEQLNRRAQSAESFTPKEKEDFSSTCDRWLRCAREGKLSIQEMEFALQNVATKENKSGRLSARTDATDDQLRDFYRRVANICDKYEVSKEPFEQSVAQVFKATLEEALEEK